MHGTPERPDRDRILFPLDAFYERAGLVLPLARAVEPAGIPEPYHSLLVHDRDMTPTLQSYHGSGIHLRPIGRRQDGETLSRLVVLTLDDGEVPVEFGAIAIHLERFPAEARQEILGMHKPLGNILADYGIQHRSRPRTYLEVRPDALIRGALGPTTAQRLYGRQNTLWDLDEHPLADVVEILPPTEPAGART